MCQLVYFLIELLVSLAITAVIMVGIGSSMLIAGRALPDADCPADAAISAGRAAEQLAAELQYAIDITNRSATMVEFNVADRSSDDIPETNRYEWSGAAGDPLTRQYNGGSVVDVLENVRHFDLSYKLDVTGEQIPVQSESGEMLLASFNSLDDLESYPIKDSERYGQYFFPSLPADTIGWKVTRIQFYARVHGGDSGECRVQLQLPTAAKLPSGSPLESKTLLESTLQDWYTKQEFSYSGVFGLSPDKGLCIVFKWISGSDACDIRGCEDGEGTPSNHMVKSTNGGASWTPMPQDSMRYWVYGTATVAGEPQTVNTYYLRTIGIELRTGDDSQSSVRTAVKVLNKPEVIE